MKRSVILVRFRPLICLQDSDRHQNSLSSSSSSGPATPLKDAKGTEKQKCPTQMAWSFSEKEKVAKTVKFFELRFSAS
jgi:hypothetical protein